MYFCETCNNNFDYKFELIAHRANKNINSKCKICFTDFVNENDLNNHAVQHLIKCNVCGSCFTEKFDFDIHLHTENNEAVFKCELCDVWFAELQNLKDHIGEHIPKSDNQCVDCGQQFKFKTGLIKHNCLKCPKCFKVFRNKERFEWHACLRGADAKPRFQCSFCDKYLTRMEHLRNHLRKHTEESPYKCNFCPKSFFRQDHLTNHLSLHTEEKKFICDVCGEKFVRKSDIKNHMRKHAEQEIYVCNTCGTSFRKKLCLSNHLKQRYLGKKEFGCEKCGKTFLLKGNLLFHMKSHSKRNCIITKKF